MSDVTQTTPALTEVEVLYEFDGPLIVVLQEPDGPLWLTNAAHMGSKGIDYFATQVTQAEIDAVKEGRMSLRGAYADKPWREMRLDRDGYRFLPGGGPADTLDFLPHPGTGLRPEWEGLPDRMPDTDPTP